MDILNNDEIEKLNEIKELYNNIQKKEDINEIINNIEKITEEESKEGKTYLNSLLYPEKYKNVKIPSEYPIPSCTYSFHDSYIFDVKRNFQLMFNPFFLYKDKMYNGYYGKYIDLNGDVYEGDSAPSKGKYYNVFYLSSFFSFDDTNVREGGREIFPGSLQINVAGFRQLVPDIYIKYRLVSACVILKYIDKTEKAGGIIGGSIITEKTNYIGGSGKVLVDGISKQGMFVPKELAKYYDLNLVRKSIYNKEVECLDGIKLVYFPIDNSYEEFVDIIDYDDVKDVGIYDAGLERSGNRFLLDMKLNNNYSSGFYFYVYAEGATPYTKYKVDLYCNFECLPNLNKFNYLSVNTYNMSISSKEKQSIIKILQGKSIDSIKNFYNVLDWKNILESINQKGIKLIESEPLLGKKRNYDEIENKEKNSEINDKKIDEVNKNEEEISNEINEVIDNDNEESLELLLNNVVKREERLKQIYEKNKDNPIFDKERYEELIKKNNEQKDKINDILNKLNNN